MNPGVLFEARTPTIARMTAKLVVVVTHHVGRAVLVNAFVNRVIPLVGVVLMARG